MGGTHEGGRLGGGEWEGGLKEADLPIWWIKLLTTCFRACEYQPGERDFDLSTSLPCNRHVRAPPLLMNSETLNN